MGDHTVRHLKELAMRTLMIAIACTAALAWSGVSQAAQISSPTIYGSLDQHSAECSIINGGTNSIAVSVKLVSEFGDTIGPINCGGPKLEPGEFCSLFTVIDNTTAYACVATAGSTAN